MATDLLNEISELFSIDLSKVQMVSPHEGGRNTVYSVADEIIIRISNLQDRCLEDYLAETEYVHYLASNGASVADIIRSVNGNNVEVIKYNELCYAVACFQYAKGDQLASHGYQYIDGRPIAELWFNTGKALGIIHSLSKSYSPEHIRFDFFDKYNEEYIDSLIPDTLICEAISDEPIGKNVKNKLNSLLNRLCQLSHDEENYGMIHFDFSDGNYNIDYSNGSINVFDFDNCRTGWYMFDLANLWSHGVGWIAWNDNSSEREDFMRRYFISILEGYCSVCKLTDEQLSTLELMIDTVRMENIIDDFEVKLSEEKKLYCDEEQAFRLYGLLNDLPFMGFFSDIYDSENPFELEA